MVGAPRPPAAQIRELHSRTSWFGHGPQTHTKTGRWNQVLIMATAWLAQRSQHEPAPRISCSIEPGGARARIGSCADPLMQCTKKSLSTCGGSLCGSLPNPACLQVHDAARLPTAICPLRSARLPQEECQFHHFPLGIFPGACPGPLCGHPRTLRSCSSINTRPRRPAGLTWTGTIHMCTAMVLRAY